MDTTLHPTRRAMLAGAATLALPGLAMAAPARLTFAVFRNGARIGEHVLTLSGDPDARTASSEVEMVVKLGPVPVFRYRHQAVERWRDGRFAALRTATSSNGKRERVEAEAQAAAVAIEGSSGRILAPASAHPLTHWNPAAFAHPLFNPQTGRLAKVRATRVAPGHWTIRGEAEIDDFYDAAGQWRALVGRLEDGSKIEYRRV